MEITLRKAAALQLAIGEALKELPLDTALTVSIYDQDPEAKVSAKVSAWANAMARRAGLLDALYGVRVRMGAANQSAGVNDRLAELARLERDIQLYTQLSRNEPREASDILKARTDRLRSREPAPTGRFGGAELQETVQAGLFGQEEIDGFRSELRRLTRRRQNLKDELLELNAATRIGLDPAIVATLHKEELI
jgi:hypothetical protein